MKMFTRKGLAWIALLIVVGLLALCYSPVYAQFRNLRAAGIHAKKIAPILDADPRFHAVKIRIDTGSGGCLMLLGKIASDEDEDALKNAVLATNPPVEVIFGLNRPHPKPEN